MPPRIPYARLLGGAVLCLLLVGPARAQETHEAPLVQAQVARHTQVAPALDAFYRRRAFALAWFDGDGPSPQAQALTQILAGAQDEGLRPEAYHAEEIARRLAAAGLSPEARAELDVLLTDAFMTYGAHLLRGRVAPGVVHQGWHLPAREADVAALLETALQTDRVEVVLVRLRPLHPPYTRLLQALAAYRRLAEDGGWPLVPDGPTLEAGDRGERVGAIRTRLARSGDLPALADTAEAAFFDAALEDAVRAFQGRHGLERDGRLGRATRAALNVPVEARIRQLEINMERWRWLPDELGRRHVFVNLAACRLEVVEAGAPVLQMRIIRGTRRHQTPVLSTALTDLVLAPYWNVPASIATGEILPALRKDAAYLARKHMTLFQGGRAVDPAGIDWATVSARSFPYRVRQDPGPFNALGRLKFVLPNPFGIGLHDTNEPYLFQRSACAFSHGCVRLEKPLDLARYALRGDAAWTAERLDATIARWVETPVGLPEPIPIHVLYFTAWVDERGAVHFRDDDYRYDALLAQALQRMDPRW